MKCKVNIVVVVVISNYLRYMFMDPRTVPSFVLLPALKHTHNILQTILIPFPFLRSPFPTTRLLLPRRRATFFIIPDHLLVILVVVVAESRIAKPKVQVCVVFPFAFSEGFEKLLLTRG